MTYEGFDILDMLKHVKSNCLQPAVIGHYMIDGIDQSDIFFIFDFKGGFQGGGQTAAPPLLNFQQKLGKDFPQEMLKITFL